MKPILLIEQPKNCKVYERHDIVARVKDRLTIKLTDEHYVKDLNLNIKNIKFPMNLNLNAYIKNIETAKRYFKKESGYIAPRVWRKVDYNFYSKFQKDLLAYSITSTIQTIFRLNNKSIRSGCVVIYDPVDPSVYESVMTISKFAKYIVFLTNNIPKAMTLSDYVMANYGISPIVTKDKDYALKLGDFIVTSKKENLKTEKPTWFLDNLFVGENSSLQYINDVTYFTPWFGENGISLELLGAILCQMEEKDVEKSLRYNGVYLNHILFNNKVLLFK
ncbi:hypothetical protein GCM10008905_21970 [Clostridium malenominatum]|uniref:Uncharacterized protein n=1 Tax=Clostridium malenominatum TaxID=1539 RepID=A0ABN1J1L1_9CLOT